jgi:PBP1b-binding outer membrane lipoprotein LpoB
MWSWIVTAAVGTLGLLVAWLYKRQYDAVTDKTAQIVKSQAETVTKLNAVLASQAGSADIQNQKDQDAAKKITTAPDAASFLSSSLGVPGSRTGASAVAKVQSAISARRATFVTGFSRR